MNRRPGSRNNRGRIATAAGVASSAMTPSQFTAAILAATTRTNLWLVHGDAGVNQATTPGRVSSLTSQGGANDWTTASTTAEPSYTASDATLGGRGTWRANGTNRGLICAYNPPAPATQPHYRISVVKIETWSALKAPEIQAAANRFGLRTHTSKRSAAELLNPTVGPTLDFPEQRWVIVESYFSGSTSDFATIGNDSNTATGVNTGTTDPASLAFHQSNAASVFCDSAGACSVGFALLPTAPERAAIKAALYTYYGPQLLQPYRVMRYFCVGDSITRNALATNDDGWRKAIKDTFWTQRGLTVYSEGSTTAGTYGAAWTRHGGISGNKISDCYTYLLDAATGQIRAGGQLENTFELMMLMIGTNNMSTYSAGVTINEYITLVNDIKTRQPNIRMAVFTIPPQGPSGNNANVIAFNAELLTAWDTIDAADPTKPLIRIDANAAISGGTGLYDASKFGDDLHPNDAGHAAIGAAAVAALDPIVTTLTTM